MIKHALCIKREDAPAAFRNYQQAGDDHRPRTMLIPWDFFDEDDTAGDPPLILADRALCETDPQLLQLLPYITVFDVAGNVFVYQRGGGGGEGRLIGQMSLGLGGHIDGLPPAETILSDWCAQEAARELQEEVGLVVRPGRINFTKFICDPVPGVGRVHMGLHARVVVSPKDFGAHEDQVITKGAWVPVTSLFDNATYNSFEPWSRAVLDMLAVSPPAIVKAIWERDAL